MGQHSQLMMRMTGLRADRTATPVIAAHVQTSREVIIMPAMVQHWAAAAAPAVSLRAVSTPVQALRDHNPFSPAESARSRNPSPLKRSRSSNVTVPAPPAAPRLLQSAVNGACPKAWVRSQS